MDNYVVESLSEAQIKMLLNDQGRQKINSLVSVYIDSLVYWRTKVRKIEREFGLKSGYKRKSFVLEIIETDLSFILDEYLESKKFYLICKHNLKMIEMIVGLQWLCLNIPN